MTWTRLSRTDIALRRRAARYLERARAWRLAADPSYYGPVDVARFQRMSRAASRAARVLDRAARRIRFARMTEGGAQ